ncbi:MAG: N-acetyltransferase, partial [Lachnospiraceae bacterium]|nr:N-acetyltransferase [Lachnospiraceae bacterium]
MALSEYPYVLEQADQVPDRYLDRIDATLVGYPLRILETNRCIVREISEQDIPALYEIYKEPDITRFMEGLYEDPQKELAYTRDYIKWHYGLYEFGMWIIADHKGRVLG